MIAMWPLNSSRDLSRAAVPDPTMNQLVAAKSSQAIPVGGSGTPPKNAGWRGANPICEWLTAAIELLQMPTRFGTWWFQRARSTT